MSEFSDIMDADVPLEVAEKRMFEWATRMFAKLVTGRLSEQEAADLMKYCGNGELSTATGRQQRRERRFRKVGKPNGLDYAAMVFEKDVRTIRRWCEKGYFPGAKRTQGGHWRIPRRVTAEQLRLHPEGFGRGARTLFGTSAWKEFSKEALTKFGPRFVDASAMEAALQDKSQSDFMFAPTPFSTGALNKLKTVLDTGQIGYATLRNLARRLFKEDPSRRLNYKLLADALHINASTLYRRYGKQGVRSAVRSAKRSLSELEAERKESQGRGDWTGTEKDEDEINAKFEDIHVDKGTPSPHIKQREPNDSAH